MAKVKSYKDNNGSMKSVWNDKGDKRYGFVSRDRDYQEPQKTRYGIGIDNMGSPYRGTSDNEINTPLGRLDYGYEGDTVYAGLTPNAYTGSYSDPQQGTAWAGIGDWDARASRWNTPTGTNYAAGLNFPDNVDILPDFYKSVNTPVGTFGLGTNDGNPGIYADYQPNAQTNYYIQALANLLNRGK